MTLDWNAMADDLRAIRADNEISLVLRRGTTTLAAQLARVEISGGRGSMRQTDAGRESTQGVVVLGEPDMDIALEDRFTHDGILYRVTFIQPNRRAGTIAEGVAVQ